MRKTDEMKKEINAKRAELERLQREEQMDAAIKTMNELNKMMDEYSIQKSLEDSDFTNFIGESKFNVESETTDKAILRNRAFNKLVFKEGRGLTEAERDAYFNISGSPGQPAQVESISSKGGYLVPEEQMKTLYEFKEQYVQLKNEVTVVQVTAPSGKWPTLPPQKLEFQSFAEMTPIAESDITFAQASYSIEDKGLIIPVSNQLIEDADIQIIDVIGNQLAISAVKGENKDILDPLEDMVDSSDVTVMASNTAKSLTTAITKDLNGIFYDSAKIYTNQSGMDWLSNLLDGNNRPLLQPDIAQPDAFRFRGKPIIMLPDDTLPNTKSGGNDYAPFFVGNMKAYMTFFERKGLELALSRELFFARYGTALRAVVRYGTKVIDDRAMIALKVKV
ncbi:MAG: phage major capsid protein [Selenomonadaceae bacterium]|nr:phage major capsid protein [Selenomonadaceae bacterium]MBR1730689.1 phage major capsid protein [Selenomonadaceae bacterium]